MDNLKKGRDLGVAIIFVAKIFAVGGGKGVLGFPQIFADKRRRYRGLRVMRYALCVMRYGLCVMGYALWVMRYGLWVKR